MSRIAIMIVTVMCAMISGVFAQVIRPTANNTASANSFGGSRQPTAMLNMGNRGSGAATWSFGGSTYSTTPTVRGTPSSSAPTPRWSFGGGSSYPTAPDARNSATTGSDSRREPIVMTFPVSPTTPWDAVLTQPQAGVTNAASTNRNYSIRQETDLSRRATAAPTYPVVASPVVGAQPSPVMPYSGAPTPTQLIR